MPQMNKHHRINVWRVAHKCPVCGAERRYSQANFGGIECNCSDKETCGFTEFFPTSFIHNNGDINDMARWEVLDGGNNIKPGWVYNPSRDERVMMASVIKEEKERRIWWEKELKKTKRQGARGKR